MKAGSGEGIVSKLKEIGSPSSTTSGIVMLMLVVQGIEGFAIAELKYGLLLPP